MVYQFWGYQRKMIVVNELYVLYKVYKRLYQSTSGGIERIQCFIHVLFGTLATIGPQKIRIPDDCGVISLST